MTDLSLTPFHVAEMFDDVNDSYWLCNELIKEIVDEHAPMNQRVVKHNQVPYMNAQLRKAINVRNMLRRKFDRNRSTSDCERYTKQRNYVTKLRKKEKYLSDRCKESQIGK